MNISSAEENYIKAIYKLQGTSETVSTNALAHELQTKPASVTDMARRLKEKKLIAYEKYQGIALTAQGHQIALGIIRRHRLWECFLVEKLQFSWEEVHELAEELEHIQSAKLIDRLSHFLGHPKADPHGDPIPDANGKIGRPRQVTLLHGALNKKLEVIAVADQSNRLLEFLTAKGIKLGTQVEILQRHEFDNSMEIKLRNRPPFMISEQVAKNIYVK